MYSLNQISNAAAQLTGEPLEGVRQRIAALQRFDRLLPAPSVEQELLESVLVTELGSVGGQTRPFGVREAKPVDEGLVLRLERAEDVQALFTLLPHRPKKGAWRGVRGLTVQVDGARLRFGFRSWVHERSRSWQSTESTVWVAGSHGEDLTALLAAHEKQVSAAGHSPQWDPQRPEAGPKRQEPVSRSLVRRLGFSRGLGSALLRRPRLWDSLAGYAGVRLSTRMADYGLDWIVERSVAGEHFDEARMIEVLTDDIVGYGLDVLEHSCGAEACTVRMAPPAGVWGWRSVLTVNSRHTSSSPHHHVSPPRPLTVVGDHRNVSRPPSSSRLPVPAEPDRSGAIVQLTPAPRHGARQEELAGVAEQIAAVWTVHGLVTALVQVGDRDDWHLFSDPGKPPWATGQVPNTVAGWRRLRIAPPPGELWTRTVPDDDEVIANTVAEARRAFDRVFLVGRSGWLADLDPLNQQADMRVLVHRAEPYERHIRLPADPGRQAATEALTPAESAIQWRQQELGWWAPKHSLAGMLLLPAFYRDVPPLDEFDRAVEGQLARYGTPVLGRFPDSGPIVHGAGHSTHPPTVLDPETDRPSHAQMTTAALALARRLWPELPDPSDRSEFVDARSLSQG